MENDEFGRYFQDRYQKETQWYDCKSMQNQRRYRIFQWVLIITSVMTPALVGALSADLKWLIVVISSIAAVCSTSLKTFKYQELWINYRTICETLKKEEFFYTAGIDEYSRTEDKEALFVERVESIISRENTMWVRASSEQNKKK